MNERIRELLKQSCGFEYDEDGHELTPILVGKDLAKFAELIVRECAEVCHKLAEDSDSYVVHDGDTCAEQIKKHFGVEE
jgi:hypothetical protein